MRRTTGATVLGLLLSVGLSALSLSTGSLHAGISGLTERISLDSAGAQSAGGSSEFPSISDNGRFVAFYSHATNLVAGDTNGVEDIFVRDRQTGLTERVNVDSEGNEVPYPNGTIYPTISGDGRFVVFNSGAPNLVQGDTNGLADVFVHDRQTGITERVSVDSSGSQANNSSYGIREVISADGRFVAFESAATNLVTDDTNGFPGWDVFVHDRQTGATERVSVDSAGNQANGSSYSERISADGRFVAFASYATNLVPGDTNGVRDIFVHDRQTGVTQRMSVDSAGSQANGDVAEEAWISANGRFVAFGSYATNLVAGDTNGLLDVFVHDRQTGNTERVNVATDGTQANYYYDNTFPTISGDGRYVAFPSRATNLVPGDTNNRTDVFLRDRQAGTTTRVNLDGAGGQANDESANAVLSSDGRFVAFASVATNLVAGDTNGLDDVFLRDRCPDGSCVLPEPPRRVVIFAQGINSEADCAGNFESSTQWLRNLISGADDVWKWVPHAAGLPANQNFEFAYYGYFSGENSYPYCLSPSGRPVYEKADSCWTLDDNYRAFGLKTTTGQATQFAAFINQIVQQRGPNVKIDILAHSQGGTIALYAYNRGLIDLSKVNSIVTFDGVDGGLTSDQGTLLAGWNLFNDEEACGRLFGAYDSPDDMKRSRPVIRCIMQVTCQKRSVPVFALDAVPGVAGAGQGLGKSVNYPGYGQYIEVGGAQHGDPWGGGNFVARGPSGSAAEKMRAKIFIGCAVSGAFANCQSLIDNASFAAVLPLQTQARSITSRPGAQTLRVVVSWPGSTVSSALISPSGQRFEDSQGGVVKINAATSTYWEVTSPESGAWSAELVGTDVDPAGEDVVVAYSDVPGAALDQDLDGTFDANDNCLAIQNPDQVDTDGDGQGDACDSDGDNDGIEDASDNCPLDSNASQADADGNSLGDACDSDGYTDGDADGIVDNSDNCPLDVNSEQENFDEDWLGDSCDGDDDSDGCSDVEESASVAQTGGLRDPMLFWDFFDVPTGASLTRDRSVAGTDFFALLARFGASGDPGIDPLSTPPAAPAYHTAHDRSPPPQGGDPWDSGAADGAIAGTDFFLMLAQFGHSCA